jgi:hypothetical protein
MMSIDIQGLQGLTNAIKRNPKQVIKYGREYMRKGLAEYMRTIRGTPWRVGGSGGGAPVATGNLRDSHLPPIYGTFQSEIRANNVGNADYAKYVHAKRPWLDYAKNQNAEKIKDLQDKLLQEIVTKLAK